MSTHLAAEPGQIAPVVLMPGDPLRARWVAQRFLTDAICYNEVRGMLGYTGTWQGHPVSVQGSGMGQPSMAIYAEELFRSYDVQSVIRIGSCGALKTGVAIRDVIIGSGACTDSSMNTHRFGGYHFAPVADFGLLRAAVEAAEASSELRHHVGLLFSSDSFYSPRADLTALMTDHGVLGIEMEAAALYTIAAAHQRRALAICTVSDHLVTGEETSAAEREQSFEDMVRIALSAAFNPV